MSNLTPQEKAREILHKYYAERVLDIETARRCALICVDEILNDILLSKYYARYRFWEQVKKEIELL